MKICSYSEVITLSKKTDSNLLYEIFHIINFQRFSDTIIKSISLLVKKNSVWKFFLLKTSTISLDLNSKKSILYPLSFHGLKHRFIDNGNPSGVPEIFWKLYISVSKMKRMFRVNPDYMRYQSDVNEKMRSILIDWLIDVHFKFKLCLRTLFLCINIVDRFMSFKSIIRQKLQLLGITSMLMASKYEELYAPETKDFVYISDNSYTKDDIFKMENLVFCSLNFQLFFPSPLFFLSFWVKILKARKHEILLSVYCLEVMIQENYFLGYCGNLLAISSILCSYKILNPDSDHLAIIRYGEIFEFLFKRIKIIENSDKMIKCFLLLNQNEKQKLTATRRKYALKKYGRVSEGLFSVYF
jgi:hypothetical protein